jgi:GNAT superfamily N-acetyltransferase
LGPALTTVRREDGYEVSTDPARLDLDLVHRWLSTDAYWALGRPRAIVERSVAGSANYGLYRSSDRRQVGFARAVTDEATFAWLCDVYVDRAERGAGLGTWLVSVALDDLRSKGVRRLLLATADAHGVYAKLGFTPLAEPARWMEISPHENARTAHVSVGTPEIRAAKNDG